MEKLKIRQILSITLTLFAVFFGAGNMIFPPAMGQQAGENYIQALAGFILTDAGIALLGMIAVVLVGTEVSDLGELVSRRFAVFLSVGIYLLIGPLFGLPRTGSVSFELAVRSYVTDSNVWWVSLIVTGIFFGLTYYLSGNPKKVVNLIGKYLTPILLICILLIFLVCIFMGQSSNHELQYGSIGAAQGAYAEIPFFQGMMEGYYALDGPAGLVFAIIIINAVRGFQVKQKKNIVKYTLLCGAGAALILAIVYYMLTYIGAVTLTPFSNGGNLLHAVASDLLGPAGGIVLGIAVFFACMTTAIGLTTSFADYFHELFPNIAYKKITAFVCLFSFIISNVGLDMLVKVSLPILMMIYPVTVVLIVLSFFRKWIGERKMVYVLGMLFAFCVAFVDGMERVNVKFGPITGICQYLPFYDLRLGWIFPAVAGGLLGLLPIWKKFGKHQGK
ncbi:MAG: branched-chain amino acid transport system II carrier protein [[Ruminococcus] gnavus]|nr:branched-chain amino acid transport system II carrier protein [Mediterraneibacter gnavus]